MRWILFALWLGLSACFAASRPPVTSNQSMVVSAQHLATQIGLKILQRGGNAVDAAVAIGYAQSVVHPCCGNIGGGGFMLVRLANGRVPLSDVASRLTDSNASDLVERARRWVEAGLLCPVEAAKPGASLP